MLTLPEYCHPEFSALCDSMVSALFDILHLSGKKAGYKFYKNQIVFVVDFLFKSSSKASGKN